MGQIWEKLTPHSGLNLRTKRRIDRLIIHCAATKPGMDIGVMEIDSWHRQRGWSGIGYHHVIRIFGEIETGRDISQVGAHVAGHNTGSIGVCLVGGVADDGRPAANFTDSQWASLGDYIKKFRKEYPHATIHGHNEFDKGKACPSFDVQKYLVKGRP